ncbi:hypothetical protein V6Z12_D02G023100 [Gossypium hirsutum]
MAKAEVVIVLSLLLVITVVDGLGGRMRINDVKNNKEVQELGRFSVEEYNRRSQGRLRFSLANGGPSTALVFSQVVGAEKQVVAGIKYYLKIKAMQGLGTPVSIPWSTKQT